MDPTLRDKLVGPLQLIGRTALTEDAVHSAIRTAGIVDARSVAAVVLESDGTLSVLRGNGAGQVQLRWDPESRSASWV